MRTLTINIRKPLYGSYVYIREEVLDKAIRNSAMLEIVIPRGSAIVDPIEWKKNGKIMKKVFKIPTCPMVLYGGNVPIPVKEKGRIVPTKEEPKIATLF